MNWRDAAACSEEDPELFFPISGSGLGMVQIGEAKAVCGRCPVTFQCLEWALGAGPMEGVWGGTTESERRALRGRTTRERLREAGETAA
ncbi:WhiB family transcriptional regulator [Actinacidiphila glaucinigra]|uniref:WhiB family transcriptional regulator n=1 Tax=Actinacidiphila glaucinigra TaxID=235986 RepID=UPI002DDB9221|nr:WhiB family transcriptional regulator [Actinacidiphila glaucinigra]WSD63742.1 WhiB family transcriptional regulator [Actinacidiphila glaucinigra]